MVRVTDQLCCRADFLSSKAYSDKSRIHAVKCLDLTRLDRLLCDLNRREARLFATVHPLLISPRAMNPIEQLIATTEFFRPMGHKGAAQYSAKVAPTTKSGRKQRAATGWRRRGQAGHIRARHRRELSASRRTARREGRRKVGAAFVCIADSALPEPDPP